MQNLPFLQSETIQHLFFLKAIFIKKSDTVETI